MWHFRYTTCGCSAIPDVDAASGFLRMFVYNLFPEWHKPSTKAFALVVQAQIVPRVIIRAEETNKDSSTFYPLLFVLKNTLSGSYKFII